MGVATGAVALVVPGALWAQPATIGWPEVIEALKTERSQAEICVGLLKKRADAATLDKAELSYGLARADMDGVIDGLTVVLSQGGKPENLPNVRPSLETTAKTLKTICEAAAATATPNTRGVFDEIAKGVAEAAIEPIVNKISDGVAALWAHYVVDPDKLRLETTKARLEAAKWPKFGDIAAQ